MRAINDTRRGHFVRRIAHAIGAITIASGIAVTGVATTTFADSTPIPLNNDVPGATAPTGTGICAVAGLDATKSYWHFVLTKQFEFDTITLNLGADNSQYNPAPWVPKGPSQAYVEVPQGSTLTSLIKEGSFATATVAPPSNVNFVLSHTCTGPEVPPPPTDVCSNIQGNQTEVPPGDFINEDGNCVPDVCTNLEFGQETVPAGYTEAAGMCTENPPPVDVCNNVAGDQATIPAELVSDNLGGCVPPTPPVPPVPPTPPTPPVDLCSNIAGDQTTVPAGYSVDGTICTAPPVDVCNNIVDNQASIPAGKISNGNGGCIDQVASDAPAPSQIDLCSNLSGDQVLTPAGYTLVNGSCELVASEAVTPPADVILPVTGSNTMSGIAIGLAMVGAGLILSALARRRSARNA